MLCRRDTGDIGVLGKAEDAGLEGVVDREKEVERDDIEWFGWRERLTSFPLFLTSSLSLLQKPKKSLTGEQLRNSCSSTGASSEELNKARIMAENSSARCLRVDRLARNKVPLRVNGGISSCTSITTSRGSGPSGKESKEAAA